MSPQQRIEQIERAVGRTQAESDESWRRAMRMIFERPDAEGVRLANALTARMAVLDSEWSRRGGWVETALADPEAAQLANALARRVARLSDELKGTADCASRRPDGPGAFPPL